MIFKSTLKFALLAGVFMIVIYHLSFWLGVNPQIDLGHLFVDLVLIGLFVFFAEKDYKTYKNGGILHFWQGMTIGFIVYALGSAIFLSGQIFYYNFDADAVINYQSAATKFLEERSEIFIDKFGEDMYQLQLEEIKHVTKWDLIQESTVKKIIAGFFITPVISIILRKQPN
ncbi:DUF4199 domain-containing protein [Marinoscillum pacificum]|uniref:DUF4199 domain-containing protein n=1 Tax=Marinoscillum pacificum TaxID=392723 RepID=UPI002158671A|nr:DUF4199 domain-containing protein [Marinoscillum pacificum]